MKTNLMLGVATVVAGEQWGFLWNGESAKDPQTLTEGTADFVQLNDDVPRLLGACYSKSTPNKSNLLGLEESL